MIAIFAILCQLAFSHVQCAPKSKAFPVIQSWWLDEVYIRSESTRDLMEDYTPKNRLVRYDNSLQIDTLRDGSDEAVKVIACFKVNDLYALLDTELYAITQHPYGIIRMTLTDKNDAKKFKKFFEPTPLEPVNFRVFLIFVIIEIEIGAGNLFLFSDLRRVAEILHVWINYIRRVSTAKSQR